MTDLIIGDVRPRVQYAADGEQTVFGFPFPILDADDLVVVFGDGEAASAYSVSGVGASEGGAVTFAVPPPAETRITLYRDMEFARETDFQEGGDFRAAVINAELDRMAMLLQQAGMTVGDTLRKHPHDLDDDLLLPPAADRAGKVLAFDEDGLPSALTAPATSAVDAAASAAAATASRNAAQASAASAAASAASAASAAQNTFSVFTFTAAGGETAVSGADDAGRTLAYAPGALLVALNGAMLVPGTDFTATDGTTIAGLTALAPGDVVSAVAFGTFSVMSMANLSLTDTSDPTKVAQFNGSSISSGFTRTFAFPDRSGEILVPEIGTWTPTLGVVSGIDGVHTYSVQNGHYVRFGPLCWIRGQCSISYFDESMTGSVTIKGLPYANALNPGSVVLTVGSYTRIALDSGSSFYSIAAVIRNGSSDAALRASGDDVAPTKDIIADNLQSGSGVSFCGIYQVSLS
ncbi:MAG: hypothetical protein AB7G39_03645 [Alphaproteobacteria bacterium]